MRFGFEFTLLRLGDRAPDPTPFLRAAASRGLPLALAEIPCGDAVRDLYEADLAIVRPDQIVAWRGDRVPADPDAVLAQIGGTGRAGTVSPPPDR